MWNYLRSWFEAQPEKAPLPEAVTIRGIRFPADGTAPHLLSLTTTNVDVPENVDCTLGHAPDLRAFWKTPRAWQWRGIETFRLEKQPLSHCNGLYVLYYSFDTEALPMHNNFPEQILKRQRTLCGDSFVVRLKGNEIGEEQGEDGWATWIDVPEDILSLPIMEITGKGSTAQGGLLVASEELTSSEKEGVMNV